MAAAESVGLRRRRSLLLVGVAVGAGPSRGRG